MKKLGIVAAIILASIPFFVVQISLAYTSPGKPTGFVNDFANIIPVDQKSQIETILSNYQKQSGNEIAVATVPSLGDETIDSYAVALFQDWGIGQKGKDNGLLLVIAPNERLMRIEVGYGLEQYITDVDAANIISNILTPAFKQGDYGGGINQAVTAIIGTLNGQVDAIPQDSGNNGNDSSGNWIFFFLIPIWLVGILGRSKSWWLGGVLGGIGGIIIGFIYGFFYIGIVAIPVLIVGGLLFDFLVSRAYASRVQRGLPPPWWFFMGRGGRGPFGGGGGFGGFGGGGSGGGGASGGW